ncbi:MAG: hypothetical protein SPF99_08015 [Anaerobutyricum sp.]|nr:hypothetical protein [Anaerobutyricum sp.]
MGMMQNNAPGRVCKWDNLKCFLIMTVVIGHFVNQYAGVSDLMKSLSVFIYSFHMPLFIFLSGLLERKWDEEHPFRWSKPVYYIMIGYTLKFLIYGIKILFHQKAVFHWFGDTGIPWYMFAMAALMVLTYLLRNLDPRLVFPGSIVLACLAGYDVKIGSFLYLSRIIVFFPFYYLGYHLNAQKVQKSLEKPFIKLLACVEIGTIFCFSFGKIDEIYSYIRLLTGRNAYALINIENCGFVHRLGFYLVAFLMGAAIISLIPDRKMELPGKMGQRTLQIYFWHRLVLYVLMFSGSMDLLIKTFSQSWEWIYLALSCILPVLLMPKVFSRPLLMLSDLEKTVEIRCARMKEKLRGRLAGSVPVVPALELLAILVMLMYYGGSFDIL